MIDAKLKRGKTSFKEFDIKLETVQRPDVVLKTILRQIRRYYILKFNKTTNYIKCKRGKGPEFFRDQLRLFVNTVALSDKTKAFKEKIWQYESPSV
jgi:hypothetical protein